MFPRTDRAGRLPLRLRLERLESRTLLSATPLALAQSAPPLHVDYRGAAIPSFSLSSQLAASQTFRNTDPVLIAPGGRGVALLRVDQDLAVQHLQVRLNVTHPHVGELHLHLQSPRGTDVTLTRYAGGSGENFRDTVFDDNGGSWVVLGRPPFSGTYRPAVALSAFNGQNARGLWKLWVEEVGGNSPGTIDNWSLTVN